MASLPPHDFAPEYPNSTKCKWCAFHENVHPITGEPMQKHNFKPGPSGGTTGCDVPGCGKAMSDAIHHPLDRGTPASERLPDTVNRVTRDQMLVSMAEIVRSRSTCLRGQVGVVIAHNGRIVAMGYNGAPPGMPHCTDVGCEELVLHELVDAANGTFAPVEMGCQRIIHAEANAIAWAARAGNPVSGCHMYCTHSPCANCAKLIVSAGIAAFHYVRPYRAERLDILEAGHVKIFKEAVS